MGVLDLLIDSATHTLLPESGRRAFGAGESGRWTNVEGGGGGGGVIPAGGGGTGGRAEGAATATATAAVLAPTASGSDRRRPHAHNSAISNPLSMAFPEDQSVSHSVNNRVGPTCYLFKLKFYHISNSGSQRCSLYS